VSDLPAKQGPINGLSSIDAITVATELDINPIAATHAARRTNAM